MSDIKFSCPQCGQHIAAGQMWASRQIPCPKCQAVLTVPGQTSTAPPPIPPVLPFAVPPPVPHPVASPARQAKGSSAWIWIIAGVGVVAVVGIALIVFLGVRFYQTTSKKVTAQRQAFTTPAPSVPPVKGEPRAREKDPAVITDPGGMEIPDSPAAGTLRNEPFRVDGASASHSFIVLKQGKDFFPDASLTIFPFLKGDEKLDGRKIIIAPDDRAGLRPHIHVARKDDPKGLPKVEIVTGNYALRLEFGERQGNKLPGRIYLEMGRHLGTKVAGTFEATVGP